MGARDAMGVLLRPGITGFGGYPGPPPDAATFRASCHAALRGLHGKNQILWFDAPNAGRNHHRARLLLGHAGLPAHVLVLLNEVFPIVAFARASEDGPGNLLYTFLDAPALAAGFYGAYEIAAAEDLQAPFDGKTCERRGLLDQDELAQASSWDPAQLGHVVFNHWD
ncbi:hypothetical protein [Polyangium mundeleinium]|uniref:Uncharacterized protein n=1 Tax=Polyangium mundeleinium TaxID=2995306 RepID=A0ABT5EK75_9BACT|nr:hypothetical protein [Polyangium mundeleinium]MDC0741160.1 hypothetical protein [Polyangium mundeleinium]